MKQNTEEQSKSENLASNGLVVRLGERQLVSVPDEALSPADEAIYNNIVVSTLNAVYNWGRRNSLWPVGMGLACCAIEFIGTQASRYDLARFGSEAVRPSPRQSDLMIVSGTVTKKMAPVLRRIYDQMAEPRYVIAMGACACSGGPFVGSYNVVMGVDEILPVDVYVPGCPPRPEALIEGIMAMQRKIDKQRVLLQYVRGDK
ncbi:MAG: NADH-quinone oxidoreductase subunit B [Chloroflexi bacterium]|nr:NADH-quinone oxidoreductase subunit B [Chloroflexota bacterium]MDA8188341.1 NADH-quinone oxidoreductase subunit B [Dehalococcoidales bacterium]